MLSTMAAKETHVRQLHSYVQGRPAEKVQAKQLTQIIEEKQRKETIYLRHQIGKNISRAHLPRQPSRPSTPHFLWADTESEGARRPNPHRSLRTLLLPGHREHLSVPPFTFSTMTLSDTALGKTNKKGKGCCPHLVAP